MLRRVDAEADPSDRITHTIAGTNFFDAIPDEPGLSVLLFDIDDVLASHDEENSGLSPGAIFSQLLHDYFPTARSIAHIGDYHFCVLLKLNETDDEVRAINRLCSDAKKLLCFADGHEFLTPFVGHLQYNPDRDGSLDDMLLDAERMFIRHERVPTPDSPFINQFLKDLVTPRKTIF
jgi:GGDEF domain-containing protein